MFHEKIYLNLVLLLLLLNFLSGFRLELLYVSLIVNIRWSLTHHNGFQLCVLLPQFIEITSLFCLCQQNKSSESKVRFRLASNCCKRMLETAKLAYATKTLESITSLKLGSQSFWWIANSVLNKGKVAIHALFIGLEVLSSAQGKAKSFTKNFSRNRCYYKEEQELTRSN